MGLTGLSVEEVLLALRLDPAGYDAGVVVALEEVDLGGDLLRRLLRADLGPRLEDRPPSVVLLVDLVDRDAGLSLAGGVDRLMDVHAEHPLAPILGQEGGVDIEDQTRIGIEEEVWYECHIPRQHDRLHPSLSEVGEQHLRICQLVAGEVLYLDPEPLRPMTDVGVSAIDHHAGDGERRLRVCGEVLGDLLHVGSVAGSEYCYLSHGMKMHELVCLCK